MCLSRWKNPAALQLSLFSGFSVWSLLFNIKTFILVRPYFYNTPMNYYYSILAFQSSFSLFTYIGLFKSIKDASCLLTPVFISADIEMLAGSPFADLHVPELYSYYSH
ncbi:hypothetical protein Droror1_Dr00006974 [Drosera rotundifolia]